MTTPPITFPNVTRITVVGRDGIAFERYNYFHGVEVHLQDDDRTIKIFPMPNERTV